MVVHRRLRAPLSGGLFLGLALLLAGCIQPPEPGPAPSADPGAGTPDPEGPRPPGSENESKKLARVGNKDDAGVAGQPDWNAMAAQLKTEVEPRLPDPLPASAEVACQAMLDAAISFYESTEPNTDHRKRRRAELAATREADQKACVANTSIKAAACVSVLLGDRNSEFPWLLDQCSRAFPG